MTEQPTPKLIVMCVIEAHFYGQDVREIFELEGYDVLLIHDGQEALETARQHKPDCIVAELRLPRLNGYELLEAARADAALGDTPFVFLTLKVDGYSMEKALALGAVAFVTAPIVVAEMLVAVAAQIHRHEIHQPISKSGFTTDVYLIETLHDRKRAEQVMGYLTEAGLTTVLSSPASFGEPTNKAIIQSVKACRCVVAAISTTHFGGIGHFGLEYVVEIARLAGIRIFPILFGGYETSMPYRLSAYPKADARDNTHVVLQQVAAEVSAYVRSLGV